MSSYHRDRQQQQLPSARRLAIGSRGGGAASSFFVEATETFENVKVSALVNLTGDSNDQNAVLARGDLTQFNAYAASIDFARDRLILSKIVGGTTMVLLDDFDILQNLSQAYQIELEEIGNQLTGRLFDATGVTELASLTVVDTNDPLLSGLSGLATDISETEFPGFDDPNNATFDNFSSMAIPVPGTVPVLAGALVAAAVMRRLFQRFS